MPEKIEKQEENGILFESNVISIESTSDSKSEQDEGRVTWSNNLDFFLSSLGYAGYN